MWLRASSAGLVACFLPACTAEGPDSGTPPDTSSSEITAYDVAWSTAPSPMVAGEAATFTLQVTDQDGRPVDDLQQNHERMVHAIFVSADLASFTHTHQEDYAAITADNLRNATFSFPLTLPVSGRYLTLFDYAHNNKWLQTEDALEVTGGPAQAAAPDLTPVMEADFGGVHATLTWTSPPIAGYEADWTVSLTDADGAPVTDVVPFLGADAHCVLVNADASWGNHTHAWFPDMANMTPSMAMPHLYPGPDIPFAYTFPSAGAYKIWVQLTRESAPDTVFLFPFVFEVAG